MIKSIFFNGFIFGWLVLLAPCPAWAQATHLHSVLVPERLSAGGSGQPANSGIGLGEPSLLVQYRWQSMAIGSALLLQAGLIMFLLHERHLRRDAEAESRNADVRACACQPPGDGRRVVVIDRP